MAESPPNSIQEKSKAASDKVDRFFGKAFEFLVLPALGLTAGAIMLSGRGATPTQQGVLPGGTGTDEPIATETAQAADNSHVYTPPAQFMSSAGATVELETVQECSPNAVLFSQAEGSFVPGYAHPKNPVDGLTFDKRIEAFRNGNAEVCLDVPGSRVNNLFGGDNGVVVDVNNPMSQGKYLWVETGNLKVQQLSRNLP